MDNVSISAVLSLALGGDNSGAAESELGMSKVAVSIARGIAYADGTGSGQCDVFYHDRKSITTLDKLDFNGAVLKDGLGAGLAITKIKLLYIKNLVGGNLEISNDGANVFPMFKASTDTIIMPDDGQMLKIWPGAGLTIGAATGKLEFVHGEGGGQDVEIIVAGVR